MKLLTEKNLEAEIAIDKKMLTLAEGRTTPPEDMTIAPFDGNPNKEQAASIIKLLFGVVPKYDPELSKRLCMSNWTGDPLSDVAILKIRRRGDEPHQIIEQFLEGGIDAVENPPPELEAIWKDVSEDPEWLDWDKLELGAKAYRGYGVYGFQFQGIATLDGYRSRNIARTLMSTGQYSDETAFKRFLLTCNFWTEVSETGGMRTFGDGWKVALRVRLLHTLIRRAVFSSERWEPDVFGMPINQLGLLGAPVISSLVMGVSSRKLGWKLSDEEIEGIMHLWRYVSHVMGYDNSVVPFPETIEEGRHLFYQLLLQTKLSDDPDGIRLCKSFMDCFEPPKEFKGLEKFKRWWEYKANLAMTLLFVSPETRKVAEIRAGKFWGIVYFIITVPMNIIRSKRRLKNPAYAEKLDKKISKERREWVEKQLGEADLVYRPKSKY
ncbi:oxygenase MpaB family protein [Granulosicoccus antarcticus]|uniref:ER-bound oxygenase mpaB/mpaB'/Rubber oxygenase catalytic domain-containing protein n=1 Tax=Granulosicoccus antarcticus IMCC3135 TaxID=1192854 RepID=A0A2Z2NSD4_9GAMM|nr:oxygenase MpaB family protein [Granulosicoccus antarcticus]ASJ72921.1 hypothetical protein IMCC3135_14180 [Granulosicoccus antarcticus IMCC3135]